MEKKISYFEAGVLFLGVFCVLAGFGLIIASNWALIPPIVKLLGGLSLLGLGLFGVYISAEKQKPFWMELSLFYAFLMVGANIALVQQLYHLAIGFSSGALIWAALSAPLAYLSKKQVLPALWTLMLLAGMWDYIVPVCRLFEKYFNFLGYRGVAGIFFIGFCLTYFSSKPTVYKTRSVFIFIAGLIMLFGDTFLGHPFFNNNLSTDANSPIGVLLTVCLLAPVVFTGQNMNPRKYFNWILIYVALQIVLLFWTAQGVLFETGLALAGFGVLLLALAGLHALGVRPPYEERR